MEFQDIVAAARGTLEFRENGPQGGFHSSLVKLLQQLKVKGITNVNNRKDEFDHADKIYRAYRQADNNDTEAKEKGEPIKIYYPITYAQTQTAISMVMGVLLKDPFFELSARQPSSIIPAKLMEMDIQYQLDRQSWPILLRQMLLDGFKYGFSPMGIGFEQQKVWTRQYPKGIVKTIANFIGADLSKDVQTIGYEGNVLRLNDPYNFMWDTDVSVGDVQSGRFVCTNRYYLSLNDIKLRSQPNSIYPQGEFFNVDKIPAQPKTGDKSGMSRIGSDRVTMPVLDPIKGGQLVLLEKFSVKLVPNDYALSTLTQQQVWDITLANDTVIVQAEPSRFEHGKFPVTVLEYSPDMHAATNEGLVQTIDGMQEWMNWLLNSRMDSVRRMVNNQAIVDPQFVDVNDLENNRMYVKLVKGMAGRDIRSVFQQLQFTDTTASHIRDASSIFEILQRTTGISDNIMGMQTPTVHSATEILNTQRMGSGRIRDLAMCIFYQALRPMAEMMIANTQQFVSKERFLKLTASKASALGLNPAQVAQGFLTVSPEDLQGMFDVVPTDPLTPQDKQGQAQVLIEILKLVMQSPETMALLGADPSQFVSHIMNLKGIMNTQDFISPPTPEKRQALLAMLLSAGAGPKNPAQASAQNGQQSVQSVVQPDSQILKQVQAGNLTPVQTGTMQ